MGEPNRAPAAGAIVMVRVAVLLLLRLAGVVLIVGACLSLIPVLEGLNKSLPVDNPLLAFRYNAGKDFITLVVRAATGLALCLLSARMTAWMVPAPGSACLRCGHRLDPANAGVCPECGGG
jgi:hypothetical protein